MAYKSSVFQSSAAAQATICWARMSKALKGIRVVSIILSFTPLTSTADSERSSGSVAMILPLLVSLSRWPALPMRCIPLDNDFGLSTLHTRSIEPISMPNSKEDVATTASSSFAFNRSSMSWRMSLDMDPW